MRVNQYGIYRTLDLQPFIVQFHFDHSLITCITATTLPFIHINVT